MFWPWGSGDWSWLSGLLSAAFWIGIIVVAVLLLRRELPNIRVAQRRPPALDLLEERYARGEISREEFLDRRAVLLHQTDPPGGRVKPSREPADRPPPAPPPPPEEPPSASQL